MIDPADGYTGPESDQSEEGQVSTANAPLIDDGAPADGNNDMMTERMTDTIDSLEDTSAHDAPSRGV